MQPDAILAAVADFRNCIERNVAGGGAARHLARELRQHTAGLEPEVKIMDFVDAQPEFTKAFWDYVDLLVTDERIARGREIAARSMPPRSMRSSAPTGSTATSSRRSGASRRNTAPSRASGR